MPQKPTRRAVLAAGAALLSAPAFPAIVNANPRTRAARSTGTAAAFVHAAEAHGVPRDLLVALSHSLTRVADQASTFGGHGVMQLEDSNGSGTLGAAAELVGRSESVLRNSTPANIDGAAALLRAFAADAGLTGSDRAKAVAWYEPVVAYSGIADVVVARLYADAVYAELERGIEADANAGGLTVEARPVRPLVTKAAPPIEPMNMDYPPARWVAAHSSNYTVANRPGSHTIDRVIIHTAQGSYAGTISWFQNPSSNVSSHYVVRSADGQVTQMVRHKDIGWHAGNWNSRSVGIEHEGFVDNPSWYTEEMYRSSAALTRFICDRHGIALDRTHIVGHNEVPGATHTDPGPNWDWPRYMSYVRGDPQGWSVIVDNEHAGFQASGNWVVGDAAGQYGGNHRHAQPVLASDVAWFHAEIPATGSYRVDVWYPQHSSNNSRAPYVVAASGGNQSVFMDQRSGGGRWNTIGVFTLEAGNKPVVGLSRWTGTEGWLEADAVRISEA